jgi:hypothetical protein
MKRWSYPICLALLALGGALALWSGATAYGWVALAAVPGVIATRLLGRRLIAVLVLALAAGIAVQFAGYAAAAALILAAGFILGAAPGWPKLGTRYERKPADDPWAQLDRGEDPTLHPKGPAS